MRAGGGASAADGGGGGSVRLVNGDNGPVVELDAGDVGADPAGTASAAVLPAFRATGGATLTVSGTGMQTYISRTTPALPAGTYSVDWVVVATHTSSGSVQGVQVTIGALPVPTSTIDGHAASGNGAKTRVNATGDYVHAGGTIAVLVAVRRSSGTGNIALQYGRVEMRRVA